MARIKFFEAEVIVAGEPLPEYEPDEDEKESMSQPNTIVKYIESVSDAEFSFKFTIAPRYRINCDCLTWDIRVDGNYATGVAVKKENLPKKRSHPHITRVEGVKCQRKDQWTIENFKFSDLSFEQQTHQKDKLSVDHISRLGTLKVDLWRYNRNHATSGSAGEKYLPLGKVSEKDTKGQALSHTVGLATGRPCAPNNTVNGNRTGDSPLATFIFKYRSKKALRDLMIIPRSPSPPLPPEERPVENLTVEEMRELIERQRAEATIKEEIQPGIKREARDSSSPRRSSSSMTAGGSGIDPDSDIECTGSRPLKKARIEEISLLDD